MCSAVHMASTYSGWCVAQSSRSPRTSLASSWARNVDNLSATTLSTNCAKPSSAPFSGSGRAAVSAPTACSKLQSDSGSNSRMRSEAARATAWKKEGLRVRVCTQAHTVFARAWGENSGKRSTIPSCTCEQNGTQWCSCSFATAHSVEEISWGLKLGNFLRHSPSSVHKAGHLRRAFAKAQRKLAKFCGSMLEAMASAASAAARNRAGAFIPVTAKDHTVLESSWGLKVSSLVLASSPSSRKRVISNRDNVANAHKVLLIS
mmetsp:Transcript_466/g.948  ORF Transcript_466/g.948 Transcript_466/m.948 type:complete len:261 (-) Transcript_466:196-978(-)